MHLRVSLPALLALLPVGVVRAQDRAREVEPILTEETRPNAVAEYDLRLTADYRRRSGDVTAAAPHAQLFFGIAGRLGGEVEARLDHLRHGGVSDRAVTVGAGLKWQVAGGEEDPLVLGVEGAAPVGGLAEGAGESAYEVTPFVALRRNLGVVIVQGNVGPSFERKRGGGGTRTAAELNLAAMVPLGPPVYAIAELNGRTASGGESARAALAAGIKGALGDELWLGAAVPVGLTSAAERWGLVVQIQRGF